MPAERLQYLIDAIWRGGGATQQASAALGSVGASARETDIRMAAVQSRSDMLGRKMSELGREVAKGNLSVEEASRKYKEFENTLADVGGAAQTGGRSLGQLVSTYAKGTAALAGLTIAAKKGYEALKEGADLELARSQFDNLAASVNSTGDAMLGKLQQASKGLATDAELIAAASGIISTGLANNAEDVVRLANVSTRLGLDMQQVILTFANNSKARLDSLGLAVSDVTSRQQELVAAGKDLDSAFDQAVLEGLENRVSLLGDASETTAGKIQQVETAYQNAVNTFKQELAIAVAENVDLDALVEDMGQLARLAVGASQEIGTLISVLDKLSFLTAPRQGAWLGTQLRELIADLRESDFGRPLRGVDYVSRQTEEIIRQHEKGVRAADDYGEALNQLRYVQDAVGESAGQTAEKIDRAIGPADEFSRRLSQLNQGVGIVNVQVEADTAPAEEDIRALIQEHNNKRITLQLDTKGIDPSNQPLIDYLTGELKATDQRARLNIDAELDEKQILTAFVRARENMSSGDLTLDVEPNVDQEPIDRFLEQAVAASDTMDKIQTNSPYEADVEGNFESQFSVVQGIRRELMLIPGTYTATVRINQVGNPYSGPYDTGGSAASGGGGSPPGGPKPDAPVSGAPVINNFYGTNPNEVMRVLQDRGWLPRDSFR